jgi:hypothetical protein
VLSISPGVSWAASAGVALVFIGLVLLGTHMALRRRSADVDPIAWVLTASVAGGSMSVLALALL